MCVVCVHVFMCECGGWLSCSHFQPCCHTYNMVGSGDMTTHQSDLLPVTLSMDSIIMPTPTPLPTSCVPAAGLDKLQMVLLIYIIQYDFHVTKHTWRRKCNYNICEMLSCSCQFYTVSYAWDLLFVSFVFSH